LRLTGEVSTDPSTASGSGVYNLTAGEYDTELLAEAGFDSKLLPPIVPSGVPCGALTDGAAKLLGLPAGIPIITGAADSVCGVLGTGASRPGDICQIWGSSTAVIAVTGKPVFSPRRRFIITPLAETGACGAEADILSTGIALDWLAGVLSDINEEFYGGRKDDVPVSAVSKIARKARAGADGLLFYPFFSGGEQGVLWDTSVSATAAGLSVSHRLPELARSLLEGMCYEARRCVTAFHEAGCAPRVIRCAGACSDDVFFMRMLADVTGLPVDALPEKNASAAGAALLAGIGAGMWRYEDVPALPVCRSVHYRPDMAVKTLYDESYKRYILNTPRARRIGG
jgi:sugar (pentulose or hexulose) kinase